VSELTHLDLGDLGFDAGAHLLLKRVLDSVAAGGVIKVWGSAPELAVHLRGWCRAQGHRVEWSEGCAHVTRGSADQGRWRGAERAGEPDGVRAHAAQSWGLAARGATVEAGGPSFDFPLDTRTQVWTEEAGRLYARAAAAQWDPATAIDWETRFELPPEVERAVVQLMTYLIENETAALLIPARFVGRIHPHFREVVQVLAIQAADEARHIEVFTRRALLKGSTPGLSTVGGQTSLKTLLDEPDFALASFLLSVMGEGTFLTLLRFLHEHAPDPVTRQVAQLAGRDEARHVAFGIAHLSRHVDEEPTLRARLAHAVERRAAALAGTAGLNEDVFDALVLLAAGGWEPEAIRSGWAAVQALERDMAEGRNRRLERLGFDAATAQRLSELHTKNFM
jgi:hypothetical protein